MPSPSTARRRTLRIPRIPLRDTPPGVLREPTYDPAHRCVLIRLPWTRAVDKADAISAPEQRAA